jgi:hypothetical protein
VRRAVLFAIASAVALVSPAPAPAPAPAAASSDPYCTASYGAGDPARAAAALRFGIDPEAAGSVGSTQGSVKPEDPAKAFAALAALRPPGKELVLRVNRLFWSDGEAGIQRFRQIVAADDAAGYDVELQVRYHPTSAQEGDIAAWTQYVRHVVDVFGPDPHVVAMTITNEDNINVSPNTSDGSYRNATGALTAGIVAARAEADAHGWRRLSFGFTYAWRFSPSGDAAFWNALAQGGPAFTAALGFVGVDAYPGSFYPPAIAPGDSPGQELVKALATVRECWMPIANLGAGVPIWVTENGYPTTPGSHTEAEQAQALDDMVTAVRDHSATYNVTDYRWFNLRDNNSTGTGTFDTDGLLRDDYTPKPSFARLQALIAAFGAATPATPATATPPAAACVSSGSPRSRIARVRYDRRRALLNLAGTATSRGCSGAVRVYVSVALAVGRRCRFLVAAGRFGPPTSCRSARYLPAGGGVRWRLRLRGRLRAGAYKVWSRAVDPFAVERKRRSGNFRRLRVR